MSFFLRHGRYVWYKYRPVIAAYGFPTKTETSHHDTIIHHQPHGFNINFPAPTAKYIMDGLRVK